MIEFYPYFHDGILWLQYFFNVFCNFVVYFYSEVCSQVVFFSRGEGSPDILLPSHILQLPLGEPNLFPGQMSDEIHPACSGSAPGVSSYLDVPRKPLKRCNLISYLNHLNWFLFSQASFRYRSSSGFPLTVIKRPCLNHKKEPQTRSTKKYEDMQKCCRGQSTYVDLNAGL